MERAHLLEDLDLKGPQSRTTADVSEAVERSLDVIQRRSRASTRPDLSVQRWAAKTTSRGLRLLSPTRFIAGRSLCQSRGEKAIRYALGAVLLFIAVSLINALRPSYSNPPARYKILEQQVLSNVRSGRGNVNNEKIFIAANIINGGLVRGEWGRSVLELIDLLGEDNVFVSIFENDSGNGTRDALQTLGSRIPCNSSIVIGAHLPLSSFPTIHLPNGEDRVQRVTYLSEVRNQLLRPLDPTFAEESSTPDESPGFRSAAHITFDRILFLNDVYFSPLDAVQLLFSTNSGHYRTACAVDFIRGPFFYDTFAVRDAEGYGMGWMFYPWFSTKGSATSRNDVRSQTDAVRVRSCWGGMAAFDAALFQRPQLKDSGTAVSLSSTESSYSHPHSLPISFRSTREPFWEAAECCLVFADIEAQHGPPAPELGAGVFINPYVRVAYTQWNYDLLPLFRRFERLCEYMQYVVSSMGYPEHNPRRTHEPGQLVDELVWTSIATVPGPRGAVSTITDQIFSSDMDNTTNSVETHDHWTLVHRPAEPGGWCGQRRMFVMKPNLEAANTDGTGKNWEKIAVPRMGR